MSTAQWSSSVPPPPSPSLLLPAASYTFVPGPVPEDFRNSTGGPNVSSFCDNWEALQHNLFQVANLFFCTAFLVPRHFKQSVLLFRFLLVVGSLLTAMWAGFHLCAFDVLVWNVTLLVVNAGHTVALLVRFLPPALSPDLTELFLKVFRPLRVSKKAFKELAREATVLTMEAGEMYAAEGCTPADERLSILLRGKLCVTCEGTLLHHINVHNFVDSPEWEANQDTSESSFQVSIAALEPSAYLCWQRLRLQRVLRHRPQLRIVVDTLVGKDITHKLYSLNEQLGGRAAERARGVGTGAWQKNMARSLSVDAVNTSPRGRVRSRHKDSELPQMVANHFPARSPFTLSHAQAHAQAVMQPAVLVPVPVPVIVPVLAPPPTLHQARSRSMRRAGTGVV